MNRFLCIALLWLSLVNLPMQVAAQRKKLPFDLQGHTGAKGLMPENSIPGFIKALELGVNTLEMDVIISEDGQVVVSHDHYMPAWLYRDSLGQDIAKEHELTPNIYQLTYAQISTYDCGSKPIDGYTEQYYIAVRKPLLAEVIDNVVKYLEANNLPAVAYTIEVKGSPFRETVFQPSFRQYSDLVYDVIKDKLPAERVIIQWFDFRVLQHWREKYPAYRLPVLVHNENRVDENLEALGFIPPIYSPHYQMLTKGEVKKIRKKSMRVIRWTVDQPEDMKRLTQWGLDHQLSQPRITHFIKSSKHPYQV